MNVGNYLATGRFWQVELCTTGAKDSPLADALPAGVTLPVYPPGADCNVVGLSALGEHAVRG